MPNIDNLTGPLGQTATNVSSDDHFTSFSISTSGADRILLAAIFNNTSSGIGLTAQTVDTVTDSAGLTWQRRSAFAWSYVKSGDTIFANVELWWAHAPSLVSSDLVTVTYTDIVQNGAIKLMAVSGVQDVTAPWGAAADASDTSGSTTTPGVTLTTSSINDFVIGIVGSASSNQVVAGPDYARTASMLLSNGGTTNTYFTVQVGVTAEALSAEALEFGTATEDWGCLFETLKGGPTTWEANARIVLSTDRYTATTNQFNYNGIKSSHGRPLSKGGKYYWEVSVGSGVLDSRAAVGFDDDGHQIDFPLPANTHLASLDQPGTTMVTSSTNSISTTLGAMTSKVVGICMDLDLQAWWASYDGITWNAGGSADPTTGVGGQDFTGLLGGSSGLLIPFAGIIDNGASMTINCGGDADVPFVRSPPTGFDSFDPSAAPPPEPVPAAPIVIMMQ